MPRIKIRAKQEQAEGVDTRSFKLGYQVGFREAEAATIDRLNEHYEPIANYNAELEDKLKKAKQELQYLRGEHDRLVRQAQDKPLTENVLRDASRQLRRSNGFASGGLVRDDTIIPSSRFLGMDLARDRDVSAMLNMDMSDVEARVLDMLSSTDVQEATALAMGLPSVLTGRIPSTINDRTLQRFRQVQTENGPHMEAIESTDDDEN